jgi:hypothetical protein
MQKRDFFVDQGQSSDLTRSPFSSTGPVSPSGSTSKSRARPFLPYGAICAAAFLAPSNLPSQSSLTLDLLLLYAHGEMYGPRSGT